MQNFLPKTQEIKLENALYVVATPIGNLGDITFRALQVISQAHFIICEDSRVSKKILNAYDIKDKKLLVYNDHSSVKTRQKILQLLIEGKSIALISDAGTPLISDPGYKLINYLRQCSQKIIPIPGASSLTTAICSSALACDNFLFIGFLPTSSIQKTKLIRSLNPNYTVVFFETANRLLKTLEIITKNLENRNICVARELTKIHEEIITNKPQEVLSFFTQNSSKLRGEFVILIEKAAKNERNFDEKSLKEQIIKEISAGRSLKDISQDLAQIYDLNKKQIYDLALKLNK